MMVCHLPVVWSGQRPLDLRIGRLGAHQPHSHTLLTPHSPLSTPTPHFHLPTLGPAPSRCPPRDASRRRSQMPAQVRSHSQCQLHFSSSTSEMPAVRCPPNIHKVKLQFQVQFQSRCPSNLDPVPKPAAARRPPKMQSHRQFQIDAHSQFHSQFRSSPSEMPAAARCRSKMQPQPQCHQQFRSSSMPLTI